MAKYRKKLVVIEAFQMTEERQFNRVDWPAWLNLAWNLPLYFVGSLFPSPNGESEGRLCIVTLEDTRLISFGDYIIQGVLYPCKPDIFEATYEAVGESEADR
jgi:hypothetical protein